MFRFIALSLAVLALPSFAADAAVCERAVNNVYSLLYSGPDKAKLKLEGVQSRMKKDVSKCIASTAPAVAECQGKAKSLADAGKCAKK